MQMAKVMIDLAHASNQAQENVCLFGFLIVFQVEKCVSQ